MKLFICLQILFLSLLTHGQESPSILAKRILENNIYQNFVSSILENTDKIITYDHSPEQIRLIDDLFENAVAKSIHDSPDRLYQTLGIKNSPSFITARTEGIAIRKAVLNYELKNNKVKLIELLKDIKNNSIRKMLGEKDFLKVHALIDQFPSQEKNILKLNQHLIEIAEHDGPYKNVFSKTSIALNDFFGVIVKPKIIIAKEAAERLFSKIIIASLHL